MAPGRRIDVEHVERDHLRSGAFQRIERPRHQRPWAQGKRPKRFLRLVSSMATITMSSGGCSGPPAASASRANSSPGPGRARQSTRPRVADSNAIATAQTAPLSLDKIAGFPFRFIPYLLRLHGKKNARKWPSAPTPPPHVIQNFKTEDFIPSLNSDLNNNNFG